MQEITGQRLGSWNVLSFTAILYVDAFFFTKNIYILEDKNHGGYATERTQSKNDGVTCRHFHVTYTHKSIH